MRWLLLLASACTARAQVDGVVVNAPSPTLLYHGNFGCSYNNYAVHPFTSVGACDALCDGDSSCLSFEFGIDQGRCQLTTCTSTHEHYAASGSVYWIFFVKLTPAPSTATYQFIDGGSCPQRNELGVIYGESVATCMARCDAEPTCISFEIETVRGRELHAL